MIDRLIDQWSRGAQVVWAARRASQSVATIYYWVMRRLVGLRGMPPHGADFFLVDRTVLDAFRGFSERNISVLALITWLGFSQASIEYDKQPRGAGRSGWSFSRKIRLVVDSVTAFSDFPVRLCGIAGVALLIIAVIASIIALTMLSDVAAIGLLIAATMAGLTGIQLLAVAAVGEYVWRALEEARRRPQYIIERTTGPIRS